SINNGTSRRCSSPIYNFIDRSACAISLGAGVASDELDAPAQPWRQVNHRLDSGGSTLKSRHTVKVAHRRGIRLGSATYTNHARSAVVKRILQSIKNCGCGGCASASALLLHVIQASALIQPRIRKCDVVAILGGQLLGPSHVPRTTVHAGSICNPH